MRVVEVQEWNGSTSRVIARFAIEGELTTDQQLMPDVRVLVDIRTALYDAILAEKEKVLEALDAAEEQSKRDADLVSGAMEVEQKSLAAAEAHAAHVAAMQVRAEEALTKAQEVVAAKEKVK